MRFSVVKIFVFVFAPIRGGREWGINSLLSHYFLGFYNNSNDSKFVDKDYYE